jgi:hypothetical protein
VKVEAWDRFEADLESLRQQMKIPVMSAAVVKDSKLAWARAFGGLQIVERHVVFQGVGGDLVAVLAHETRQRLHILEQLQPVLRERGDRCDVAVTG